MVWVDFMVLGMHIDSSGGICAPFVVLIVSLGIDVELVQEGLDVALILGG